MTEADDGEFDGFEALIPSVDKFGVPSNILGPHPEEFFQMLGRIVALSAGLEGNVRLFSERSSNATQDSYAALSFEKVLKVARKNLDRLVDENDRRLADDFLRRSESAILKRHVYAHSRWPAQGSGRMFGWKPSRKTSGPPVDMISQTLDDMRSDLAELVSLCKVPYWHRLLHLVSGGDHLCDGAGG